MCGITWNAKFEARGLGGLFSMLASSLEVNCVAFLHCVFYKCSFSGGVCTATHYPPALLCYLLPTNAATCGGPHSGRRIGPSSQSRANQIRVQQLRGKPPNTGSQEGSDRQTGQRLMFSSLKPFLSISTWETPTWASNWTRIPPCKISQTEIRIYIQSFLLYFSLNWRGFVVPGPNHELL